MILLAHCDSKKLLEIPRHVSKTSGGLFHYRARH
jgi:hypothetical protein